LTAGWIVGDSRVLSVVLLEYVAGALLIRLAMSCWSDSADVRLLLSKAAALVVVVVT
jgi:hypothetical protein